MKIVAVVPIKLNSTRLPNKNIKKFKNGHSLCWYIFSTLLQCKNIDEIYVYCSNSDICNFIPDAIRFLQRDASLDQDTTKISEVLLAFSNEVHADIYVMTHATAPFISVEAFEKGINAVLSGAYDSSFAVKKMQDFIWKDGKPFNYDLRSIPRTQDLEPLYVETSGFYIYKREVMEKKKRRIGDCPYLVEVSGIEGCDIDEQDDFLIADAIHYYKQSEETE